MDCARDKITGFLVDAEKALPLKKRYLCPNPKCHADCHLRIGKRKPHFVHDSGKASPDCENYHQNNFTIKDQNLVRLSNRCQAPSLYVFLYKEIYCDLPSWKLLLLIPECPNDSGSVEISDGYYGNVTIPTQKLKTGGQKVEILPKTAYSIKLNGLIDTTYALLFNMESESDL
ncbi:MAG: hypothetical protein GX248_00390 [Peptococcaceae bacterium]|jgi:hypothetical protein|nr:hypothetical protein [Peptococcaceae bacterium]